MNKIDEILQDIDVVRLAFPQEDGYDTSSLLRLVSQGVMPLQSCPYERRPTDGAVTFCDGAVAVRQAPPAGLSSAHVSPAAPSHGNLPIAAAYLARWSAAYDQFKLLTDTVYPYSDAHQAKAGAAAFGSSSHSHENDFGSILVTVDDPIGTAQALIHEMAHHKLRALGIFFERAERFILNPPDQLLPSPVRRGKLRPMTAVFHAQYSFMHITALDLRLLEHSENIDEQNRILMLLSRNIIRMKAGYPLIAREIKTDYSGKLFVDSFMAWSADTLEEGHKVLADHGYGNV